jgi:dihydropyrimidine dehydrogenase (NAD+) subunit PreA
MHYGFRIVETMISGLENWMREQGFQTLDDFIGLSVERVGDWADLDLSYEVVARINQERCIHCGLCYAACEDGAHQSIDIVRMTEEQYRSKMTGTRSRDPKKAGQVSGGMRTLPGAGDGRVNIFTVNEDTCVGCNLCSVVCPVSNCIDMVEVPAKRPSITWREYQKRLAAGDMERIHPKPHAKREINARKP